MVPVIAWLVLTIVLFQVLSMRVTAIWLLVMIAVLLGTAVNCFPLIAARCPTPTAPRRRRRSWGS